jgi:hypothetical protein
MLTCQLSCYQHIRLDDLPTQLLQMSCYQLTAQQAGQPTKIPIFHGVIAKFFFVMRANSIMPRALSWSLQL